MKTVKRELAHVGMFGSDGTTITRQHLADCRETFDGKCPVTLGHKLADWMPRFGNVKSVDLAESGDSLVGEVEEHQLLADAVAEGFFGDVSVRIQRRASDGKHYLHHLAYLGAVPPKIRDLKVLSDLGVMFCGDDDQGVEYSKQKPAESASQPVPQPQATAVPQPAASQQSAQPAGSPAPNIKEADVDLQKENERLTRELADANAARLTTAKDGLVKAMEGRVPKGKQNLVLSLADTLDPSQVIELADQDGKKQSLTGLQILQRILEAIPKPVAEGRTDLGDPAAATEKPLDMKTIMSRV